MKINYQTVLDKEIEKIGTLHPSLLLHSCCAPCSSYVLEYLSSIFDITVYYYNPNISPESEFLRRAEEQKCLIEKNMSNVGFVCEKYDSKVFFDMAKGMEDIPEGGERCFKCYELRLRQAAEYAAKNKFDYFTTTLTISPHKNAAKLNEIGEKLSEEFGVKYLFSDFKKRNGYKRSCELSELYGLYRQDYCGCVYSKLEAQKRREI